MVKRGYANGPGQGETYDWRGARVTIHAGHEETHGQLCALEFTYPVGLAVPTHVHDGEDEMFFLVDGRLQVRCDDDEWVAEPGTFVLVPRDHPHSLSVLGSTPARALVVTGPPALDAQIRAGGVRVDRPRP